MSLTNLKPLQDFLVKYKLNLEVGECTCADGSCFLHCCLQCMNHLRRKGLWNKPIPVSAETLRGEIVQFMRENGSYWTRPRYDESTGIMQDPPLKDNDFQKLITDQARERAWTDNLGLFVQATAMYLDVQIDVICPSIGGPVLPSGLAGPYMIINKAKSTPKSIFYMGLMKDEHFDGGHYQFLKEKSNSRSQNSPVLSSSPKSPSPLKIKRSRVMAKYLKSPVKKQLFKHDHCTFCSVITTSGRELENHLKQSEICHKNYLRNHKVKSIDPIILKTHSCLFCCHRGSNRISVHLKKSPNCQKQYFTRFNVSTMKQLQESLDKIKRQLRPSTVNRKDELKKKRDRKIEDELKKTEVDHINDFKKETLFSNPLQCYKCTANYSLTSTRIEEIKINPSELDDDEKLRQRFLKFYQCKNCFKLDDTPGIRMTQMDDENNILIFPVVSPGSDAPISGSEINKNVTCLLPSTVECLGHFDGQNVISRQQSLGLQYCVDPDRSKLVPLIYNNEVNKYRQLKMYGDRYEAVISDVSSRLIKSAEKVIDDSSIVASEAWRRKNSRDYHRRVDQLGSVLLHLTVELPRDSDDIVSTVLIQHGLTVTVDFVGDASNEYSPNYYIHNHSAEKDCSTSCRKVLLKTYLDEIKFDFSLIKSKYLSSYASSVQTKFNSFLRNFIKAPSSSLHSSQYLVQLGFGLDNTVEIEGQIWPDSVKGINLQIGKGRTSFEREIKEELIRNADSLLIATADLLTLIERLKISNDQARGLIKLIMENQYHRCIGSSKCRQCAYPNFPLLVSIVLEWSPNLTICNEFNQWVQTKLTKLTNEDLVLSTQDWLKHLFSSGEVIGEFDILDQVFKLTFNGRTIIVKIDERMQEIIAIFTKKYPENELAPMIGFYHYSVTTVPVDEIGGIIINRPNLRDIFITEFNPSVLKAFRAKVDLKVLNGHGMNSQKNRLRMGTKKPHWTVALELDEGIGSTHQEVSLIEAMVMFDKNFHRSHSSNPVEFIAAFQERKTFFKKVRAVSDKSFKSENSEQLFEQQNTNIERFFMRTKFEPKICLAEFVLFYDFVGTSESKDLYKLFTKSGVEIKDSDIRCAFSKEDFLPEIILLRNHDVMKIRQSKKIIAFPSCEKDSTEMFYQKVLLYSPNAKEKMENFEVNMQYCLEDDPPVCDEAGSSLTVIERIERYDMMFFQF